MLHRVCTVRTANKQTASFVSIISIFSSKFDWRKKLFIPCYCLCRCRKRGFSDAQHRHHGSRVIVHIQPCATYDCFRICTQSRNFKQDSQVAQEKSPEHKKGPAKAVVKKVDVLEVTKAAKMTHLSIAVVAAQKALLSAMKTMWCVNTEHCKNLHQTVKVQSDEDLDKSIELLLCNSLYNVPLPARPSNQQL